MIWFFCKCGQELILPEEAKGKESSCPKCKIVLTVPLDDGLRFPNVPYWGGEYVSCDKPGDHTIRPGWRRPATEAGSSATAEFDAEERKR